MPPGVRSGSPAQPRASSGIRMASDSRHNRMVLALKTLFISFWELEGKSDSIKYNKNNVAFK